MAPVADEFGASSRAPALDQHRQGVAGPQCQPAHRLDDGAGGKTQANALRQGLEKGFGGMAGSQADTASIGNELQGFGCQSREFPFPQLGINLSVLEPGVPNCLYHSESQQEAFLVLSGECRLLVDGAERLLGAWDFVHCPAGTEHVFVGAGDRPCVILMTGFGYDPTHSIVKARQQGL